MSITYDGGTKIPCFIKILEELDGEEPSEDEVWRDAREYQELPCFEDIFYELILAEIKWRMYEQYGVEMDYFINGIDTHLYWVDDDGYTNEVCDYDDFINRLNTLHKEEATE